MTTAADRNDLMPAQVILGPLLEWVTPKISLMDAGDTDGKSIGATERMEFKPFEPDRIYGPS
jgi:hypothetical protein